ncbi:MAG: autotransporter-associated beta strand repeat-containing protein [Pirellulales bacterium]|nr:autotransporter-associated beta strand repeat-containing protein [Pirellulales bacterium]
MRFIYRLGKRKYIKKILTSISKRPKSLVKNCFRFEHLETRKMLSTIYWTGNNSIDWSDPYNWSGGIPTSSDDVVMLHDYATINVDLLTNPEIKSMTFSYGSSITGNQFTVNNALNANGTTALISAKVNLLGTVTMLVTSGEPGLRISGNISGSGGIIKTGAGPLTISSSYNTYTGSTTINSGTLTLRGTNAIANSSSVSINNSTLEIEGYNNSTGPITSYKSLITGTTGVLSSTAYTFNGGTVSAILGGSGAVTINSTVTLNRSNTYTGGTTIKGILTINSDSALGAIPSTPQINVTFPVYGNLRADDDLILNANRGISIANNFEAFIETQGHTITINGPISGGGRLGKSWEGMLTLSATNSSYSGGTRIYEGTLSVTSDGALGAVPDTAQTNIIFWGNSALQAGANISLNANRNISLRTGYIATIDTQEYSMTIGGTISGEGAVTKNGAGTLTLGGANTYSGDTIINNGTLELSATGDDAQQSQYSVIKPTANGTLLVSGANYRIGQIYGEGLNGTVVIDAWGNF